MNVEMGDEMGLLMIIQQYASKFGVTFSSHLMDDPVRKDKLIKLMTEAISGRRGAVTDADVMEEDKVD